MKINSLYVLTLLIFILTSFSSCSQKNELSVKKPLEQEKEIIKCVVIGSSTAEGAKASCKDSSWVGRLENFLKTKNEQNTTINLAKSGYTTYHLISKKIERKDRPESDTIRNIDFALALKPTHVIINLPSNDAAYGYSNEEQMINFKSLIDTCRSQGVHVFVCSAQPRNFKNIETRQKQIELNKLLKRVYNNIYLDFWTGFTESDASIRTSFNSGDGIHMNDKGHRLMFARVFNMFN